VEAEAAAAGAVAELAHEEPGDEFEIRLGRRQIKLIPPGAAVEE
jgi:hypothetical protein